MKPCEIIITFLLLAIVAIGVWGFFILDKKYIEYLEKFYYTEPFCTIYDEWIKSGKCKWRTPSIDHLQPISKGGTFELSNIMFTTWFENRAKAEMTLDEWYMFKVDTGTESNLFYL